ncbi:MAG: Jag N-terminal domain-containing protein [Candidatus Omnitrophica bacterium]|nr:Jag N-terminal domain-containing protein [Candidatus Omnitrophota bacterium]MCK5178281.1 Jag N-terminal domain-containing protein [Candidatus Omnitrophota bacterium]
MEEDMPKECLPKSIEVDGGTVEEAIKRALEFLKVSREDVTIKIVCEEKKGLFGMEGAKPAKIKASLKENENNS